MIESDPVVAAQEIAELMRGKKTLAITGAGISTDSGLPDYRGTGGSEIPTVDFDMFMSDEMWQRWVWQRNHETWRQFEQIKPSPGHRALVKLEDAGLVTGIATQNIDGLHVTAGSRKVWELHGSFRLARCVQCGQAISREAYGRQLDKLNPGWPQHDHDVAILATVDREAAAASTFQPAPCEQCGGIMKPDVVMFGESLPPCMNDAMNAAGQAEVGLVVGSSLLVSTGAWVTRQAWARGATLIIINRGPTALDDLADYRSDAGASEVLTELAKLLGSSQISG
ncbi:MAG: NAD-dependent deacetylase [Actinomycetaceae bacterium]|nr:NAD-dependent deacetylase [Actinomycetaceae bacterium]